MAQKNQIRYTNLPCKYLKKQRRSLRSQQTKGEYALWQSLRRKQIGYKFVRQVSIGNCIADFYCHELRLVIEVDGGIHNDLEQKKHDIRRDAWLKSKGYNIIRVSDGDCIYDLDIVLEKIKNEINKINNQIDIT